MIKKILGILLLSVVSNANAMYRGQDITEKTALVTQAINAYRDSLPRIEETEIPESLRITNFLLRFCPLPKEEIQGVEDLHSKIDDLVNQKKELIMYMPGFPCKSRSRKKCINDTPDLGEYLALKTLEHMCAEITKIYSPAARIIIVSDGHIYQNEIVAPTRIIALYHEHWISQC